MKIVERSFEILSPAHFSDTFSEEARLIERAGRTCYKSEDKITADSYIGFIERLVKNGHEAMLEFGSLAVKFVTDRGVTHEFVRHRMGSYAQESTRYITYTDNSKSGNELSFILPEGITKEQSKFLTQSFWRNGVEYFYLLDCGASPQQARAVLPTALKTELNVRANFREWRHIFRLRAISKAAHPDMRATVVPLYEEVRRLLPCVFDMGDVENG